jgi:hypothetical protein
MRIELIHLAFFKNPTACATYDLLRDYYKSFISKKKITNILYNPVVVHSDYFPYKSVVNLVF